MAPQVMYALFNDPLKEHKAIDNSGCQEIVDLGNGTVAFKTLNGRYVSQVQDERGEFEEVDSIGPNTIFARDGNLVTSWVPVGNGPIFTYILLPLVNG